MSRTIPVASAFDVELANGVHVDAWRLPRGQCVFVDPFAPCFVHAVGFPSSWRLTRLLPADYRVDPTCLLGHLPDGRQIAWQKVRDDWGWHDTTTGTAAFWMASRWVDNLPARLDAAYPAGQANIVASTWLQAAPHGTVVTVQSDGWVRVQTPTTWQVDRYSDAFVLGATVKVDDKTRLVAPSPQSVRSAGAYATIRLRLPTGEDWRSWLQCGLPHDRVRLHWLAGMSPAEATVSTATDEMLWTLAVLKHGPEVLG